MVSAQSKIVCNSLDSTLRTALAGFYVSDTEGIRLGDFECNRDVSPTAISLMMLPDLVTTPYKLDQEFGRQGTSVGNCAYLNSQPGMRKLKSPFLTWLYEDCCWRSCLDLFPCRLCLSSYGHCTSTYNSSAIFSGAGRRHHPGSQEWAARQRFQEGRLSSV